MLDIYTNLCKPNRNKSGVYNTDRPRKILFMSESVIECYEYILSVEPDNRMAKRQLELLRD